MLKRNMALVSMKKTLRDSEVISALTCKVADNAPSAAQILVGVVRSLRRYTPRSCRDEQANRKA